ncbi:hypothetical protein evm_015324 [Chilo suppressalis]|nr:hypothetical protein evm_015324 [Chilo suppressalis]
MISPTAHRSRDPRPSNQREGDSTSSLSLDSFGSTDREIFEETVKAGIPHRASSPGSLSNESFGSTDKEVFERCVRAGISKARRPRSADRRSRPRPERRSSAAPGAPTPQGPQAGAVGPAPPAGPKNAPPPSAPRAPAGDEGPARACTGSDHALQHGNIHHHHHQPINFHTTGAQAFPTDGKGRLGHDPPRGPSVDWRVLTTADPAGTNGLTCLPKHGGTREPRPESQDTTLLSERDPLSVEWSRGSRSERKPPPRKR